jgi:hypothetical protein
MTWPSISHPLSLPFWIPWIFVGISILFSLFGFFKRGEGKIALFYTLISLGIALLLWFTPFFHLK